MNLTTLTQMAGQFAKDPGLTRYAGKYTLNLNEAQNQFCMDSLVLFKDAIYSVVANQSAYPLPADFMFEKKVTISTVNSSDAGIELNPITRAELEFYTTDRDWTQDTGTPKWYIIDPENARDSMTLYPQPQGADAGINNLRLTYYPFPTALANPNDVPLNGTSNLAQFHIAIAAYAAWLLLSVEAATQDIMANREALYKQYENKVTEARDKYGNTSSMQWRMKGGRSWH